LTAAPEPRHAPPATEADRWHTFVGRDEELATLHSLLAPGGTDRHAFIEGEAGMGKTRLVSEFLGQLGEDGAQALRGSCYQVAEAGAYFPFAQILSALEPDPAASSDLVRKLARQLGGRAGEPALDRDVREKRGRLVDALADTILQGTAGVRTVLCIEDLQWADVSSLLLLNRVLDGAPSSLFVVCAWRTGEQVDPEVRQLVARVAQRSTRIVLGGLSDESIRHLVDRLSGVPRLSPGEAELLARFTKGNPMFLRELLLQLNESGLLEKHTLRESIDLASVPEHLASMVDMRLGQLKDDEVRTLSAGAVIGSEFSVDLVAQAVGSSVAEAEEFLDATAARGILEPMRGREMALYKFSHPMFAKRLYELTPGSLRRRYHARIASIAERGGALLTVEERARHHALGFGSAQGKGVALCREAAERAEDVLAFDTAGQFWELALRCASPGAQRVRAELLRRLGWAQWASGKWERAGEAWQLAVSLFEALQEETRAAELALALGDMYRWRQEHQLAERWLTKALELPIANPLGRARGLALLGSLYCLQGRREGPALLEEAATLVTHEGNDALVTYWLSYGFLVTGDRARSYALAKSGLREAMRMSDARATTLLAASLFHQDLARLRTDLARSYARTIRRATDRSDPTATIRSLLCEALLLAYGGHWEKVSTVCESWLSTVRLAGRFQVATASFVWAEAQLAMGQTEQAANVMRRVLPDLEGARHLGALHLARVLARAGETEEAGALLREHMRALMRGPRFTDAAGRALLGEVATHVGEPKLLRTAYSTLTQEPYPLVMTYSPISVRRVLGRLAGRLGLWPEAFEHFESAVEQLATGAAFGELSRTYLDYAEFRLRRGRRGDQSKAEALRLEAGSLARKQGIVDLTSQDVRPGGGNRFNLTSRELEVLGLVAGGLRNQEVAITLSITPGTVNRHLENIYVKMGVRTRTEAVMLAVQEGLMGLLVSEP